MKRHPTPANATVRLIEGVIPILPAPFSSTGEVDEHSFRQVIEGAIQDGAHGVAMFGLGSEYAKLTDKERDRLSAVLVEQTSARVPVIISITHHSLYIAVQEAAMAAHRGADAIMLLPPFFPSPGAQAVRVHIEAVAAAVSLPVIVQYAPAQAGVSLTAETVAEIAARYPNVRYVKADLVPSGPIVSRLQTLGLQAIAGYMGLHFPEDVERGAIAVMPTVSVSRAFVQLWNFLHSDVPEARRFHRQLLPLLNFMMQSVEMLVAVEKLLLFRRGLLASSDCRPPRWVLDAHDLRAIDRLCEEHGPWLFGNSQQME